MSLHGLSHLHGIVEPKMYRPRTVCCAFPISTALTSCNVERRYAYTHTCVWWTIVHHRTAQMTFVSEIGFFYWTICIDSFSIIISNEKRCSEKKMRTTDRLFFRTRGWYLHALPLFVKRRMVPCWPSSLQVSEWVYEADKESLLIIRLFEEVIRWRRFEMASTLDIDCQRGQWQCCGLLNVWPGCITNCTMTNGFCVNVMLTNEYNFNFNNSIICSQNTFLIQI